MSRFVSVVQRTKHCVGVEGKSKVLEKYLSCNLNNWCTGNKCAHMYKSYFTELKMETTERCE